MKKTLFISALLLLTAMKGLCQEQSVLTMKNLLSLMPERVIPILTHNNMLDFLDFMSANCKAEVTNRMSGKSEMTELTDSTAHIVLTESNVVDVFMVPTNENCLIYVVNTLSTDSLTDSRVDVYDFVWQPADSTLQFSFENPATYNYVSYDKSRHELTVDEVSVPLLFEGESRKDKPVVRKKHIMVWNKDKEMFCQSAI